MRSEPRSAAPLQTGVEYEVINVLDEVHNPTVREVVKQYSDWPTLPQARGVHMHVHGCQGSS